MFLTWLTKYRDFGLLLLRLGIGGMFVIVHGWPKIKGGPVRWREIGEAMSHLHIHFAPEMWGFLAALAECGGGVLLILGFLFRPTCGAMLFTMIVATLTKIGGPLIGASQPIEMGIVFLALIFIGPGRFSLDKS
jgi:putative oxidoreductase